MLLSGFSHAERISACPRTIICNKWEQSNMRGDILNAGDNVDDQENFGFTESYFKTAPTNIDDYTQNKLLNMKQENLRTKINIEINDKQTDKRYQKNIIDDKEYDKRDQISKNDEEKIIEDIEIMKLQNLSSEKNICILRKNQTK